MHDASIFEPIKNNTKKSVIEGFSTTQLNDFFIKLINTIFPL